MAIAEKSFNRIEGRIRGTLTMKRFPLVCLLPAMLSLIKLDFSNSICLIEVLHLPDMCGLHLFNIPLFKALYGQRSLYYKTFSVWIKLSPVLN